MFAYYDVHNLLLLLFYFAIFCTGYIVSYYRNCMVQIIGIFHSHLLCFFCINLLGGPVKKPSESSVISGQIATLNATSKVVFFDIISTTLLYEKSLLYLQLIYNI